MIVNNLPRYMKEGGYTFRQVQAGTGLPYATVYRHCAGRSRMIDFDTLNVLCAFFDKTSGEVLEYRRSVAEPQVAA